MSVSSDWVVILDDDDFFFPDALSTLSGMIEKNPHLSDFPVFQISHENGKLNEAYRVVKFDDYLEGLLKGDFLPVIRRDLFVRRGYRYPESRVGGESLLWWKIALAEGIPSYQVQPLCKLGSDAPVRLTSAATQISHASAHQQLAAEVIGSYGGILSARYPNQLRKRKAAFCTYGLLAGDGKGVRRFIRSEGRLTRQMCVFFVASFVPSLLLKSVFRTYRFTQDLRA
jgi:GalNAc5-diNAcBac-PP-undecaprenol beta-1,3-glucosyltransferase